MDFAGASLKLSVTGEDKVVAALDKIDKKAQSSAQMVSTVYGRSVSQAAAAFDELYGKQSKAAKAAQTVVEEANTRITASSNRAASGVLAISRGLETMARTGKETGRSLDTLLANVGQLAFGFGGSGALVGAVAIGTAAIVEMFNRAGREMDKLAATYAGDTEKMVRSTSLMGVDARIVALENGEFSTRNSPGHEGESDAAFLARSQGNRGMERQQRLLSAIQGATLNKLGVKDRTGVAQLGTTEQLSEYDRLAEQLKEINRLYKEQTDEVSTLRAHHAQLMTVEQDRAAIELDKLGAREKHKGEFQNFDPYKKTEGSFGNFALDPAYASMAKLDNQVFKELDPLKAMGEQLTQSNKADEFLLTEGVRKTMESLKNTWFAKQAEAARQIQESIGNVLGSALANGFRTAFEKGGNIGAGVKALLGSILEGLGSVLERVGIAALAGANLLARWAAHIAAFDPVGAIAASVGLIALGAALQAGGSALASGGSGGGGSGGYGGSSGGTVIAQGIINPTAPAGPVTSPSNITPRQSNTFNIVGTRDPVVMRQIQEIIKYGNARGNV